MRASGVAPDAACYESALHACSHAGRWPAALRLLREMGPMADLGCYKTMLACAPWREALALLACMHEAGPAPDAATYRAAVRSCAKGQAPWYLALNLLADMERAELGVGKGKGHPLAGSATRSSWARGCRLLEEMHARGLTRDISGYAAAISACEKGRQWRQALSLLQTMHDRRMQPNAACYNAAMAALHGRWEGALALLGQMRDARVPPDRTSYATCIHACEMGAQWELALALLQEMREGGLSPQTADYNVALLASARSAWPSALRVLDLAIAAGAADQASFHGAITACADARQWQRCLDLLERMAAVVVPTLKAHRSCMSACTRAKAWEGALRVLDSLLSRTSGVQDSSFAQVAESCRRNAQWQRAIDVLDAMLERGGELDEASFNTGVASCGRVGAWDQALAFLHRLPYPTADNFCSVLRATQRKGDWRLSLALLRAIPGSPTVESYNYVLRVYERERQWARALDMLATMEYNGTTPTAGGIVNAAQACANAGHWEVAASTLRGLFARKLDAPEGAQAARALLAECEEQCGWAKALAKLTKLETQGLAPPIITYNWALSACARGGRWSESLQLLRTMQQRGETATSASICAAAAACVAAGVWERALQLVALPSLKSPNVVLYGLLLRGCALGSQWARAAAVLEQMRARGIRPDGEGHNACLAAMRGGTQGEWSLALELLGAMEEAGHQLELANFPHAIQAAEACGARERTRKLYAALNERGARSGKVPDSPPPRHSDESLCLSLRGREWGNVLQLFGALAEPDARSVQLALQACEQGSAWARALQLLDGLRAGRYPLVTPTAAMFNGAISACVKAGQCAKALGLVDTMSRAGIAPDTVTFNAAIGACEQASKWPRALALLQAMRAAGLDANVVSYSATISACAKGGEWARALALLEEAAAKGLASVIGYSAAMSACEKGGAWRRVVDLFAAMEAQGKVPSEFCSSVALLACERIGAWEEALAMLESIHSRNRAPNDVCYASAIAALEKGGQWARALATLARASGAAAPTPRTKPASPHARALELLAERAASPSVRALLPAPLSPKPATPSAFLPADRGAGIMPWERGLTLLAKAGNTAENVHFARRLLAIAGQSGHLETPVFGLPEGNIS